MQFCVQHLIKLTKDLRLIKDGYMANKILIPALKAKVGDWNYYICTMKYASVAREINFAYELGGNSDLNSMIQRGISERTKDITDYLIRSEHRFLGAMIVAAYGGDPKYVPVKMDESDELINGLDSSFGVLTFDGSQQYFALDGQHRLKAIKDAIKKNPELGSEEITVILVSHYNTPEGQEKTRRLFTNINKNAKVTTKSENLALDEDDAFAIITRRLINEHPVLMKEGRVAVFLKQGENGELKLATQVNDTDRRAVTSISHLYEMVKHLSYGSKLANVSLSSRPTDDDLEEGYKQIVEKLERFMKASGNVINIIESNDNLRELRKSKNNPGTEHPFLKGVIQRSLAEVVRSLLDRGNIEFDEILQKISELPWTMKDAPWTCVSSFSDGKLKMLTGREYVELFKEILTCHIAPNSKQEIIRARKNYKTVKNEEYPIKQQEFEVKAKFTS